ncbi:MAG: FliH/SctL family protein [Candidatus Oxydemutatoraceae bacterium WSBS_2016_MAG_OTU14]
MSLFSVKHLNKKMVSPVGKVIKAKDYQSLVESQELIKEIKVQAQALYEEEQAAAIAKGELEVDRLTHEKIMESVIAIVQYLSLVEKRFVEVVIESVEKVIGTIERDEQVLGMIKQALYMFRNERRITLKVANEYRNPVQERIKEIMSPYPNIDFIDVVIDHEIAPGSCRLEAESGSMVTSIENQIKILEEVLHKNFALENIVQEES